MKKISQLEWIRKAQEVHGYTYDYSKVNYLNSRRKVTIICCEHGEFEQLANSHLQGKGCQKCWYKKNGIARNSNTEEFINKAIKVHGDKYDYSKVVYSKAMEKVLITCKIHGDFKQTPNSHLQGVGCSRCATRGYNKTRFIKLSKYSVLYIIKCFSGSEVFYKIGITTKSIRERFLNPKIPYEFEIVASVKSDSVRIYDLEKKLHKMFGIASYKPMKDFRGKSECFLLDENHMKEISEVIFSEVY